MKLPRLSLSTCPAFLREHQQRHFPCLKDKQWKKFIPIKKAFLYLHITKTKQMKILIGSLLLILSLNGLSQSSAKFYYDEDMHPVSKAKAVIYGKEEMDSGLYKLTCYYKKKKNPLACVVYFSDSTQRLREGRYRFYYEDGIMGTEGSYHNGKKEGLWIDYGKKGQINDSVEYKEGMAVQRTGFYDLENNHQRLVTVDDVANNSLHIIIYDLHGELMSEEKIPQDYSGIYINDDTTCTFTGGAVAWQHYITRAIMSHINDLNDADYGTVLLRFVVDTSGNITDLMPLTMKNSDLAKIAFNAIDSGPKWIPGQHDGKKVKMILIQPVTIANPK